MTAGQRTPASTDVILAIEPSCARGGPVVFPLIVSHEVASYDRFKAVLDAHPPSRGDAVFHSVNRDVDDPTSVTIIAGFESLAAAPAWRDTPESQVAMEAAGVGGFEQMEAGSHVAT